MAPTQESANAALRAIHQIATKASKNGCYDDMYYALVAIADVAAFETQAPYKPWLNEGE